MSVRVLFSIALVLGAAALTASARQTPAAGRIAGTVTGAGGAPLAGVVVTVASPALPNVRTLVTSATGGYSAARLPAGTYSLWFQLVPYTTVARDRIVVGSTPVSLDVNLAIGGIGDEALTPLDRPSDRPTVLIETELGRIEIAVDLVHAPVTAANFLRYVDGGFYTNGRFHRVTRPDNYTPVLPSRPAMAIVQAGISPARSREGFPPIPLERTSVTGLKHVVGTVSMARGSVDSATSDFFICLDDQPSLDFGGHRFDDGQGAAAFGRVVTGLDVVRKIQQQSAQGQSLTPPVLIFSATRIPVRGASRSR